MNKLGYFFCLAPQMFLDPMLSVIIKKMGRKATVSQVLLWSTPARVLELCLPFVISLTQPEDTSGSGEILFLPIGFREEE